LIYPAQTTGSISGSSPSDAGTYLDGSIPTPTLTPIPATTGLPRGIWTKISDFPLKVNTLIADPTNPRVLYAGSVGGVYKSEDAGLSWNLTTQEMSGQNIMALAMTFGSPQILYADANGKIISSIDGAKDWNSLGESVVWSGFWHNLVVAPSDGHVLFNIAIPGGVARSDDGGYNWQSVYKGLPREEYQALALSLAIDPKDKNVVYIGTGGWVDWMPGYGVYKSTDGGETWSPANSGIENNRIIALAIDPSQPQIIYASASGGKLFKSINSGQTWENISANLIVQDDSNPSIKQIIIDPNVLNTIYLLREQSGVMVSKDGGVSWRLIGKPSVESKYNAFKVAIIFNQEPVFIFGVEDEGGWRYTAEN